MLSKLNPLFRLNPITYVTWSRRLFFIALLLLYIGWIGYVVQRDKPVDFYLYYLAADGFAHNYNIYGADDTVWTRLAVQTQVPAYMPPYRYPPLTALLVWPLTYLPPRLAAVCWLVASAGALILSAWLLGRASSLSYGVALALGLLLVYIPPLTTLHAGQVNGLLLLALSFALYAFKRKQPVWIGVGVAVGAMLKLVPVAHLAYLAWRRQWQATLTGLVVIILLFGLALPLVGWSDLVAYSHHFLSLGASGELVASGANQSLTGFLARWLTSGDGRWSLMDAPQVARGLAWGTSLILVIATVILCWPRGNVSHCFPLEFALVTISISLLTPYVWYHQLVVLLIPFFVLAESALTSSGQRWWLIPLGIGYILTDIHGLTWHYLDPYPLLVSTPFYTMIMMWGMVAWLIIRAKKFRFNSKSGDF